MNNVVLKNFILSIATVVVAGLALWASEEGGDTVNVPWLLMVGFAAGCITLSVMARWKRRQAMKGTAEAAPPAKKKGKGK